MVTFWEAESFSRDLERHWEVLLCEDDGRLFSVRDYFEICMNGNMGRNEASAY